jgi:hypothetical protein
MTIMGKNMLVRRVAKTAAALGVALGASLGSANAASAAPINEMTCKYPDGSYNICITITDLGNDIYNVHVGIDVDMSQSQAQAIINRPGNAFIADLRASDPSFDNFIGWITHTSEGVGPNGIGADFDALFSGAALDEDWEGIDEVYARVRLYPTPTSSPRTFNSNKIEHSF